MYTDVKFLIAVTFYSTILDRNIVPIQKMKNLIY